MFKRVGHLRKLFESVKFPGAISALTEMIPHVFPQLVGKFSVVVGR
jgi:hypothetical protein